MSRLLRGAHAGASRFAFWEMPVLPPRLAALQLDADAVGDEARDDRPDEDEYPVEPQLRDVRDAEQNADAIGRARDEDEQPPRHHRDAGRRSSRCVARAF